MGRQGGGREAEMVGLRDNESLPLRQGARGRDLVGGAERGEKAGPRGWGGGVAGGVGGGGVE